MSSARWGYRTFALYVAVCSAAAWTGYWMTKKPSRVTSLYYVREPKSPPDQVIQHSIASPSSSINIATHDVALIRERAPDDAVHVVYFAPKRPNQWGSVEMEFRWKPELAPEFGILEPSLHLFGIYDKSALGELAVSSEATNQRWVILGSFGGTEDHVNVEKGVDVTRWVKGARSLRVRYRLKASRLMYHPTPDDPVGYAGAQCLRQLKDGVATQLRLWRDRPDVE